MAAGDTTFRLLVLEEDDGTALAYASAEAFAADGWALTFRDSAGAALSPQPTFTVTDEGAGVHRVVFTEPLNPWWAEITVPTGYHTPETALVGDGDPYDHADIVAQLLSSAGSAAAGARQSTVLEDWIEGDTFFQDLVITAAQLRKIGKTDLTGVTVLAAAKQAFPVKDSDDTQEIEFETAIIDAGARTITIRKDVFPVAQNLPDDVDHLDYVIDVTVKNNSDGRLYTAQRLSVRIVWEADQRAA